MQSSRVLFFVVRQIAELITVVKIQTVQTAFLSYAMLPCCKTVLVLVYNHRHKKLNGL